MRRALPYLTALLVGASGIRAVAQIALPACGPGSSTATLHVNGVTAGLNNNGFQFNRFSSSSHGYEVPVGSGVHAFFSTELWLTGRVDGEVGGLYADWASVGTKPGPVLEENVLRAECDVYDRIYSITKSELERYDSTGVASAAIVGWPSHLGAPVIDGDGIEGNYNLEGGDRPRVEGHQTVWWLMNAAGPSYPGYFPSRPLPLEIRVSAFASASDEPAIDNATIYRYTLTNKGSVPIEDIFFGNNVWVELGDEDDNFVGSDTTLGLAFAYNGLERDELYGDQPPAVGLTVLDGFTGEDGEPLPMTKFYAPDISAVRSPYIDSIEDIHNLLQGILWNGRPITFGGYGSDPEGKPVDFMWPGEPGEYWSNENPFGTGPPDFFGGDRFFIWATGPFSLAPGETGEIVIAIVWARGEDRLDSVRELKRSVPILRQTWDTGFQVPLPPVVTVAPAALSPAHGASGQPLDMHPVWTALHGVRRYQIRVSEDQRFVDEARVRADAVVSATSEDLLLNPDVGYWWQVRGLVAGQPGPWSGEFFFFTGEIGQTAAGPLSAAGEEAFIVVRNGEGTDVCANETYDYGCAQFGGHLVTRYEGYQGWRMGEVGDRTSNAIGRFAPADFEIRFTENGSYASHPFDSHLGVRVPWEVWDIGDVGPFGVNEASDDEQLIGGVVSNSAGDCRFAFGDSLSWVEDWPVTDQVFAHYPSDDASYSDWKVVVEPLVQADPDGCVDVSLFEHLIDLDRGAPLQGLVFTMDPSRPDFREEGIPNGSVIRFLTTRPTPPFPSAPRDFGTTTENAVGFWWHRGSDSQNTRFQISRNHTFEPVMIDSLVSSDHLELMLDHGTTYYWHLANEHQPETWSRTWRLGVLPFVSTEDVYAELPDRLSIDTPYPNPVRSSATIQFSLSESGTADLEVYDLLGRRVETLFSEAMSSGRHVVEWNASDLSQGVYILSLRAGGAKRTARVVVAR